MKIGDLVIVKTPDNFAMAEANHPWHGRTVLVIDVEVKHSGDVYTCLYDNEKRVFYDHWFVQVT